MGKYENAIALIHAEHEIVQCLFSYIDRMNDTCEEDTAEQVLNEFTAAVMPKLEASIKIRWG